MSSYSISIYAKEIQNKKSLGFLTQLSIFVLIVVRLNPNWKDIAILWYSVFVFSAIVMLIDAYRNSAKIIHPFFMWIAIFFIYSGFSYFWSVQPEYALDGLRNLVTINIAIWLLYCTIQNKKDLIQLLKLIMYAIASIGIYIFFNMDLSLIGKEQIGILTLGSNWNSNEIGLMMAFAALIALLLLKEKVNKLTKIFYCLIIILTISIVLLSGSRKAVFFILFGYALFTVLTSKNGRIIAFAKVALILLIAYLAIMNIPQLYNVLGSRIEGLMANFTGAGIVDDSTKVRMTYINLGIRWFWEQPIWGHGINNFQSLLDREIGIATYAHNNYIELLVDVGIIGAVIYFSAYLYVLKNTFKSAFVNKEPITAFTVAMTITVLIGQYGYVAYSDFTTNLFFCIGFIVIKLMGTNDQRQTAPVK